MGPGVSMKKSRMLPFALPVGATLLVPALLLYLWGTDFRYLFLQVPIGVLLTGCGLCLVTWTIALFGRIGKGTLAPWNPTRRLVVAGPYTHTRNPMISGVFFVLLGEGVFLGSLAILAWALIFFIINTVYFKYSEEPGLTRRFGEEYKIYRTDVPMWLPRLKPWKEQIRDEPFEKTQ